MDLSFGSSYGSLARNAFVFRMNLSSGVFLSGIFALDLLHRY